MTSLLGLWSRSAAPARSLLSTARLDRMLAQLRAPPADSAPVLESALLPQGLPQHPTDRSLAVFENGAACIFAGRRNLRRDRSRCVAFEGFIAEGGLCVDRIGAALGSSNSPGDWRAAPDGHFSLAFVDADAQRLCLLRGLSGGERLYTLDIDELVLFSSSLRPLLAFLGDQRRFNESLTKPLLMTGVKLFGDDCLIEGINELPAGHVQYLEAGVRRRHWYYGALLRSPSGDLRQLAGDYRSCLTQTVCAAAGASRPVAVTLSGGIDSSAVALAAVDAFGADQVHAFTYEFDDPEHPNETHFAREVCRKLGIRKHHIISIGMDDFLAAIPETIWRAENFVHWPKAFMVPVTRALRDAGFERQLSGFGIGSHMAYFKDLAVLYRLFPWAALWLRYWSAAGHSHAAYSALSSLIHPGFEAPNLRVFELLRQVLASSGGHYPVENFSPHWMRKLLSSLPDREVSAERELSSGSLSETLARQAFVDLLSCVDITRWEKVTREIGCHRLSPAHFTACLPFAYLPYDPQLPVWHRERRARPGKHLLRIAMANDLPEAVLYRKKSWADAVISPAWLQAGARWMRKALPNYPVAALGNAMTCDQAELHSHTLQRWDQRSPQTTVTALAMWRKLFVDRPPSADPPTWNDLCA